MSRIRADMRWGSRQNDAKRGAAIQLRLILDKTAVLLDNPRGDGQAEPGPTVLGGEKGIEDAFLYLGWNATSRIAHFQNYQRRGLTVHLRHPLPCAQSNRAITLHAVRSVLYQIDQHLLELFFVGIEGKPLSRFRLKPDGFLLQLRL